MTTSQDQLIVRLGAASGELRWAVGELPENLWHTRPDEGEWSVHEIAAHTRDIATQVYRVRLARILTEAAPELQLFDEVAWMAGHYNPAEPMAAILDELDAAHREMAALLLDRPETEWARTGHHPQHGARSAVWWARQAIAHAWEHAVQALRVAQIRGG